MLCRAPGRRAAVPAQPLPAGLAQTSVTHTTEGTGTSITVPGRQTSLGKRRWGRKGGVSWGQKRRGKINREQCRLRYQPRRGLLRSGGLTAPTSAPTLLCLEGSSHSKHRTRPHCKAFPFQREVFGARDGSKPRAISPSQGLSSKTREEGSSEKRPGLPLATEKGRKPTS